jgi:hypothetical protein
MGGIEKEETKELRIASCELRVKNEKVEKSFFAGCSKMPRYEASEIFL